MATIPEALALASQHHEARNFAQAEYIYRQVVQVEPAYAQVHNNLGAALQEQGKLDEAVASYRQAVHFKPDYARAYYNLGYALKEMNKLDEAVISFQQAIRLQPDYAVAHWNLAMTWLLQGDFERGWPEYEWRWQCQEFTPRSYQQPRWDGSPLAGRTILLHAEQGMGDSIQFIRYATMVCERGGRVIVECPAPLVKLLAKCPGVDSVATEGTTLSSFDVHAPLLSLPGIFRTTLENIPAAVPYLSADLTTQHSVLSTQHSLLKIGIVWRGHPKPRTDRQRSIPVRHFEKLSRLAGVRLFSLQKGPGTEELLELTDRAAITDLGSGLSWDFMDTAGVIRYLDLVISCDTSVAHLAGALGVPVWLGLPFAPDWRWLLEREDSPWYPTMRIFRQRRAGDWEDVFDRITEEACKLVSRAQ